MPYNQKSFNLSRLQSKSLLLISVILLVVMIACSNSAKPITSIANNNNTNSNVNNDKNIFQLNKPIERELIGDESHSYSLNLEANKYLNLVVEQKGIDVVVAIYNPAGEKVYEIDSPNGTEGIEPIYLISHSSGNYRLEVRSLEKGAKAGKYEVKVIDLREAIPIDVERVIGFKALGEAILLEIEGNLQNAITKYQEAIENLGKSSETFAQTNALSNLGLLYNKERNYEKAEPLLIQALEIRKKTLGYNHPDTAISSNDLGTLYYQKTNYEKAEPLLVQALEIRKKTLGYNHFDTTNSLINLANVYYDKKDYEKAEPLYTQAVEIRQKSLGDNHPETARAMLYVGLLYKAKQDYTKAESLFIQILEIRKKALGDNHLDTIESINDLGIIYSDKQDYTKAEFFYTQAIETAKKVLGGEHSNTTRYINNLALLYYDKGDYTKAESLQVQVTETRKKTLGNDHLETVGSMTDLARLYNNRGDYTKAEPLFIQILEIRKKTLGNDHLETVESMSDLARLYTNKGDYTKAEPLYIQAIEITKKMWGNEHPNATRYMNNLAILYYYNGEYEKAEPLCIQVLEIKKKLLGNDNLDTANALNTLATVYNDKGEYQKAEPLYIQAIEIRKKLLGNNHADTANAVINLARLYSDKGEYQKAEPLLIKASETIRRFLGEQHPDTTRCFNHLARFYSAKKDYQQSIKYKRMANDLREEELARNLLIGSEKSKRIYLQKYASETDVTLSLHTQNAPNAVEAIEMSLTEILRRKGRAIDAVNQSVESLRKRSKPEDIALLDELTDKKTFFSNIILQGLGQNSPEESQKLLKSLQEEIDRLEYKISERSSEFRTQSQSQTITLQAIQEAIPTDSTLVEFASYLTYDAKTRKYGVRRYAVYLLNHQGKPDWADLGEAEIIDSLVDELRTKLSSSKTSVMREIKPLSRKLDKLIMQPVRKLTKKGQQLLLAPDGKLNLLPFAALVDERGKFLVENTSISYLTSGRDLLRLQIKISSKSSPVIIGDPDFGVINEAKSGETKTIFAKFKFERLIGTEIEAKAIKNIFPDSELLLQQQATEENLSKIKAPSILHIATHGFFLAETPFAELDKEISRIFVQKNLEGQINIKTENPLLRSGIVLAGANLSKPSENNNGVFTALEATALNLWGTKVVVLSACDTGVGEVKRGDGVYGLRRALVLAGSETQVISLWPVSDDGTKDLMIAYYTKLKKQIGRSDALRQVQLELLKNPKRQHPYYWASFIQSGEWANLDGKR